MIYKDIIEFNFITLFFSEINFKYTLIFKKYYIENMYKNKVFIKSFFNMYFNIFAC